MYFPYVGQNLNGILKHLYDTKKDSYFDIVKAYATSNDSNNFLPVNAINFVNNNKYWHAKERENIGHYFVVYLNNYYINLEGYSIQTTNFNPASGVCHPKNWGFDASNDGKKWEHQANITDDGTMNKALASRYIGWSHGTYKYFRLMITGQQHDGEGKLSIDLNQIELFGTLTTRRPQLCSCRFNKRSAFTPLSFIIGFVLIS